MNFHELKRPEAAIHYFPRFVAAKALVGYGMDIMLNVFSICNGIVTDMALSLIHISLSGRCTIQRDCKLPPIKAYQKALPPDTVQYLSLIHISFARYAGASSGCALRRSAEFAGFLPHDLYKCADADYRELS